MSMRKARRRINQMRGKNKFFIDQTFNEWLQCFLDYIRPKMEMWK